MEEDEKELEISPDQIQKPKQDELLGTIENISVPQQSPNFVFGQQGWRLNSNGIIDAVGVNLSGTFTPSNVIAVIYGGTGAQTLTGILKGNGVNPFTAITPLSGVKTYYVADSSGGAVTRKLTFTDGILTSET